MRQVTRKKTHPESGRGIIKYPKYSDLRNQENLYKNGYFIIYEICEKHKYTTIEQFELF